MLLNTRQKITYFGDLYLMFQELAQIEIDDYNNLIFSIHPVTITHFFQFWSIMMMYLLIYVYDRWYLRLERHFRNCRWSEMKMM